MIQNASIGKILEYMDNEIPDVRTLYEACLSTGEPSIQLEIELCDALQHCRQVMDMIASYVASKCSVVPKGITYPIAKEDEPDIGAFKKHLEGRWKTLKSDFEPVFHYFLSEQHYKVGTWFYDFAFITNQNKHVALVGYEFRDVLNIADGIELPMSCPDSSVDAVVDGVSVHIVCGPDGVWRSLLPPREIAPGGMLSNRGVVFKNEQYFCFRLCSSRLPAMELLSRAHAYASRAYAEISKLLP